MLSNTLFTAATAASLLTPVVATFDAQAKSNVAVYYGQGANQKRLRHFCQETSVDIINLGFLNVFPDQGLNGYPETNFGNQCGSQTFDINGENTDLLSHCPYLVEDIPICQAAGKKVLLSLGGAVPDTQKIESEGSAKAFADFLWYAFGPPTDTWAENGLPRPFKDVVLDGFDFDIEHNGGFGYAIMANRLRDRFKEMPSRRFYLSAAPQCPIPDDQLSDAIANAPFDFIWVQFYNNPGCAATNYFLGGTGQFNYDAWVDVVRKSANPSAKLFIGLPGSMEAVSEGWYYMPAPMVQPMVDEYMGRYPETFGGIMVWDATASERNDFLEDSYAASMKDILLTCAPGPAPTPSSTSTMPTSSSTSSSSTAGVSSGSSSASASPTSESTTPASSGSSTPVSPTTGTTTPASSESPSPSSPTTGSTTPGSSGSSTPASSTTPSSTKPASSGSSSSPSSPTTGSTAPASSGSPSSSDSPTHSGSTTPASSESSETTLPSSTPGSSKPGATGPVTTSGTTSSFNVGRPSSSAGPIPSSSGITSAPSVKPTATSSPETTTTIIVTSYIDICPTGFTTITTTYTSTYCPATATPTVTSQPTGVPAQTTPPPEGWTKTVTVCTHCASTPTTVTLTRPTKTGTTGSPSGTVPAGGSGVSPVKSTSAKSTSTTTVTSTLPCTPAQPTTTPIIVPTPATSRPVTSRPATSRPASSSGMRPSTAPSASPSRVPTSPSGSQGGVTPVYTGAAAQTGLQSGMTLCVALLLTALVFV